VASRAPRSMKRIWLAREQTVQQTVFAVWLQEVRLFVLAHKTHSRLSDAIAATGDSPYRRSLSARLAHVRSDPPPGVPGLMTRSVSHDARRRAEMSQLATLHRRAQQRRRFIGGVSAFFSISP